jgi:Beta-xylosidase
MKIIGKLSSFCIAVSLTTMAMAQMPIIQTKYTADPAPMVYNDTVYLYTTHDEDDADGFKMFDWLLYTSTDMVNWTDHGAVASLKNFTWISRHDNGAWAAECIERNGKFYLYCPMHGSGIGVLVGDTPYGPFHDPLGKRLINTVGNIWPDIDPNPFIDDDGQAYLYWGNPAVWYVKLNEDMISYSGEIISVPMTQESFGVREGHPERETRYEEGPWVWKREGKYYMSYASVCCPGGIEYSMSDSPEGPWVYKGCIMCPSPRNRANHPGIINYKGQDYVFGLNYDLLRLTTDKHHERRSVSVAPMYYNPDGTIQEVPYFKDTKIEQVGTLNPYRRVEAETIAWGFGLKTERSPKVGMYVTSVNDGDNIKIQGVDFGKGAKSFLASVASPSGKGKIEIRLGSQDGTLLGVCTIGGTGGWDEWKTFTTSVKSVKGVHDLYLVFRGESGELFNFDFWEFKQ